MIKKHRSVWMLLSRMTFPKLIGILILMALLEAALFYLTISRELQYTELELSVIAPENVIGNSRISWIFASAFIAYTAVLCSAGCAFGSRCGCTFRRLSIAEEHIFLWQAVHNALCYLLLWAVQTGVCCGLCSWFAHAAQTHITPQTVFLAFYRSDFLHALLPLSDVFLWVRNVLLCCGLGIASAVFPYRQREGKFGGEIVGLVCLLLVWFDNGLGNYAPDALVLSAVILVSAEAIWHVFGAEEELQ